MGYSGTGVGGEDERKWSVQFGVSVSLSGGGVTITQGGSHQDNGTWCVIYYIHSFTMLQLHIHIVNHGYCKYKGPLYL